VAGKAKSGNRLTMDGRSVPGTGELGRLLSQAARGGEGNLAREQRQLPCAWTVCGQD